MDDGRTPEHGYTISSPCEPEGSGELKSTTKLFVNAINMYVIFNLLILEKQTYFRKFTIYVAPATNQIKQFRQKSYKSGELFNKLFCKNKILLSPMRQ